MNNVRNKDWLRGWYGRVKNAGASLWLVLADSRFRYLLAVMFAGIGLWLVYNYAWTRLRRDPGPPATVKEGAPLINTEMLRSIDEQRLKRTRHLTRDYASYDRVFRKNPE